MADLDTILSGDGASAPALETNEPARQEPAELSQAQPTEPHDDVVDHSDGRKLVPLEALTEARGKVKRYTEQVAEFDKSVSGLREQNTTLQRQVTELLQRLPQPQRQEPAQAPDIYEDAPAAVRSYIQPDLDAQTQRQYALARVLSEQKLGKEKFEEVTAAFDSAAAQGKVDKPTLQRIMNSPIPWLAAAEWHDQQQRMAPDFEEKLKAKLEAELLAKHGLTPQTEGDKPATQQPAPVMPSNLATARNVGTRSGPAWGGPTPLGDILGQKSIFK